MSGIGAVLSCYDEAQYRFGRCSSEAFSTFHKIGKKNLHRHVTEFTGKYSIRRQNTIYQMSYIARGMVGEKLIYADLVEQSLNLEEQWQ